jgi:hypothetical protein
MKKAKPVIMTTTFDAQDSITELSQLFVLNLTAIKYENHMDVSINKDNLKKDFVLWLESRGVPDEIIYKLFPKTDTARGLKVYGVDGLEFYAHYSLPEFRNFYRRKLGVGIEGLEQFEIVELSEEDMKKVTIEDRIEKNGKALTVYDYVNNLAKENMISAGQALPMLKNNQN